MPVLPSDKSSSLSSVSVLPFSMFKCAPVYFTAPQFQSCFQAQDDFSLRPCLVLSLWTTLGLSVIPHFLSSKACESYDFPTEQKGPCPQRVDGHMGKIRRQRVTVVHHNATYCSFVIHLRRSDWLFVMRILHANVILKWKSQLLQQVNGN